MSSAPLPAKRQRPADFDLGYDSSNSHVVGAAAMRRVSEASAAAAASQTNTTTSPPHQNQASRRRNPVNGHVSSRTGQACDRCKTRKIRCDDTEGGCVPCRQSNSECRTTDRITQRATVRGHTENVERQNQRLQQHIVELEQQLRELDVIPRSQYATYNHAYYPSTSSSSSNPSAPSHQHHHHHRSASHDLTPPGDSHFNANLHISFPAQQDSLLSQPIGTSLSVFGMKIDLARFVDPSEECRESRTSFEAFHASVFSKHADPPMWGPAHLPRTHQDFMEYAKTFVYGINPWVPALHPPDFFALSEKLYDGSGYKMNLAETVMVHMVLANSKYQMGMRNEYGSSQSKVLLDEAFAHYHYSLTFFDGLTRSRTLPDFQAMCLLCILTRCFSSASTAWFITQITLMHAVQVGLHRSLKAWPEEFARSSPVTIQLRRCVFWTVYLVHVAVSSKLGNPLYLRTQDFDIEAPEAAETSTGINNPLSPGVSFGAIGYLYKLSAIHADMYTAMYAVCPKGDYISQLRSFEARLDKWRASLPSTMAYGSADSAQLHNKPFACWALYSSADLDLAMHHPAACRTKSPEILSSNLTACISAASNIITATVGLRSTKSVDTTWMSVMSLISALFTSLFAHWERRENLTSYDLSKLKSESETALNILSESGEFLRAGPGLRPSVQDIMDRGLTTLSTFMTEKTAAAASRQVKPESTATNVFEHGTHTQYSQQPHASHHIGQLALHDGFSNEPTSTSSSMPSSYQSHVYDNHFGGVFPLPIPITNGTQMQAHSAAESALIYGNGASASPQHASVPYVGGSAGSWQTFTEMNGGYLNAHQASLSTVDSNATSALLAMTSLPQDHSAPQTQQHMLTNGVGLGAVSTTAMPVESMPWPMSMGIHGHSHSHNHSHDQGRGQSDKRLQHH